jgi:hypothetical protein
MSVLDERGFQGDAVARHVEHTAAAVHRRSADPLRSPGACPGTNACCRQRCLHIRRRRWSGMGRQRTVSARTEPPRRRRRWWMPAAVEVGHRASLGVPLGEPGVDRLFVAVTRGRRAVVSPAESRWPIAATRPSLSASQTHWMTSPRAGSQSSSSGCRRGRAARTGCGRGGGGRPEDSAPLPFRSSWAGR